VGENKTRGYATVAYFSRGSLSPAFAVEHPGTRRITLSASLSCIHSLKDLKGTDLEGPGRNQIDAIAGTTVQLSPKVGFCVNAGRTLSAQDEDAPRFIFNAGITVTISALKRVVR
jgi:hypothetical protein